MSVMSMQQLVRLPCDMPSLVCILISTHIIATLWRPHKLKTSNSLKPVVRPSVCLSVRQNQL